MKNSKLKIHNHKAGTSSFFISTELCVWLLKNMPGPRTSFKYLPVTPQRQRSRRIQSNCFRYLYRLAIWVTTLPPSFFKDIHHRSNFFGNSRWSSRSFMPFKYFENFDSRTNFYKRTIQKQMNGKLKWALLREVTYSSNVMFSIYQSPILWHFEFLFFSQDVLRIRFISWRAIPLFCMVDHHPSLFQTA